MEEIGVIQNFKQSPSTQRKMHAGGVCKALSFPIVGRDSTGLKIFNVTHSFFDHK